MSINEAISSLPEGVRVIGYQHIADNTFILYTAENGTMLVVDGVAVGFQDGGEA